MVTSATGKQDCKDWHSYFSLTLFEFWYERNDNLFFSQKTTFRSSRSQMFFQRILSQNFLSIHKKTPEGLKICNFIKKRLQDWCFSCDCWAIFNNTFFTAHLRWLLVYTEWMNFLSVYFSFTWSNCRVTQSSANAQF